VAVPPFTIMTPQLTMLFSNIDRFFRFDRFGGAGPTMPHTPISGRSPKKVCTPTFTYDVPFLVRKYIYTYVDTILRGIWGGTSHAPQTSEKF
jgi:hypothetical protein